MKLALTALTVALVSLPTLALAQDLPAPAPAPAAEPEAAPPATPPPSAPAPVVPTRAPSYRYRTPPPLTPDSDGDVAEARPRAPQRYDYLRVGLGFRIGYIGDPAFDAFADSDTLAQVSLDASYAFFTRGNLAVAGGLAYDAGSRTSGARGLVTRLTMHRLTVPIEARYYLAPWVDVFAKVAPGAGAFYARIEDPSSPTTLEHAPWVFAADVSGGASFRLVGSSDGNPRHARLWLNTELGYGVTSSHALRPSADREEEDVLGADQSARLGSLAMNGVFWRTSFAMSF